ncbi:hypothetical protein N9Q01_00590 [Gammaproteobacteria bacterium]|nr:hypothetical protein [Gammaproteobacteria bacterium]
MKSYLNKTIVISFILLTSTLIYAEPKMLVCSHDRTAEEEEQRLRNNNNSELADLCKISDSSFSLRNTFLFDTNNLKNSGESNAEYIQSYACGGITQDTKRIKMEHSPSVITFKWFQYNTTYSFNVDRKTLRAGYKTKRIYQCSLEDIDTSENIL